MTTCGFDLANGEVCIYCTPKAVRGGFCRDIEPTSHSICGFTLIELMIASAIISLLAAIAIPKFSQLIRRSKEAVILGRLGSIRGGLTVYYADNDGQFPSTLGSLVPKYFDDYFKTFSIAVYPYGSTPLHNIVSAATPVTAIMDRDFPGPVSICHCQNTLVCVAWVYDYNNGDFRLACNHTDSKGNIWSTF